MILSGEPLHSQVQRSCFIDTSRALLQDDKRRVAQHLDS